MITKTGGKSTPLMLAAGLVALLALLASFGARFWWFGGPAPVPELLQGLGDSRDADNQEAFRARLAQKFPRGSEESAMLSELRDQGFKTRDVPPPQGEASYDHPADLNDPCRRGGTVQWTAVHGRIGAIGGSFYTYCR